MVILIPQDKGLSDFTVMMRVFFQIQKKKKTCWDFNHLFILEIMSWLHKNMSFVIWQVFAFSQTKTMNKQASHWKNNNKLP